MDAPEVEGADEPVSQATRRSSTWIVWHRLLVFVPMGAFATSFVFDIWSQKTGNPITGGQSYYARGAYVCILFGLLSGALASVFGVADLARVDRASVGFERGRQHLIAMDAVLVLFALSWLYRRSHGSLVPVPIWLLAVQGLVGLLLLFAVWLGTRLVYEHGIGAAPVDPS